MEATSDNGLTFNTKDFMQAVKDRPEIKMSEITDDSVLIDLGRFYYRSNDAFEETETLSNLRVIKYSDLENLMKYASHIEYGKTYSSQKDVINILLPEINKFNDTANNDSSYMYLIEIMHTFILKFEIVDEYDALNTIGISFDNTRQYICDPKTNLLESATDTEIDGKHFYCQFDEKEIPEIRRKLNDTDYNRFQYILKMFSKTLAFEHTRAYSKISNIMSLVLFHLALLKHSNPLENYSAHDLFTHYLAIMFDILIRSLHFNIWLKNPFCIHYISKLKKADNDLLLNVCTKKTSRERFNYFITFIDNPIIQSISYDIYESLLKKIEISVNGKSYYDFNIKFIMELLSLPATVEVFKLSQKMNITPHQLSIQN